MALLDVVIHLLPSFFALTSKGTSLLAFLQAKTGRMRHKINRKPLVFMTAEFKTKVKRQM
jgi:hypothetical protein